MKKIISLRMAYFFAFLTTVVLLGFAFYLEYVEHILACPLCILQRFCLAALGFVFAIGGLFAFKKMGNYIAGSLAFLLSLLGMFLSGRQAWLQHFPTGLSANCDVSLQYMLQVMPWYEVLGRIIRGGTECSQVNWQFLYLSLADWSFVCFGIFAIFSLWQLSRTR